jgi:DNA polymerase-1
LTQPAAEPYDVTVTRVLLIDTYSVFFRAYHALPPMTTATGQPTSALYGLCVMLLKLLREEQPLGLAFALDGPTPTFRHVQSPDYKAQRPALADPLREQLRVLPQLLEAFGAPCICVPGFEADDVLATLAVELAAAGQRVRIVTGDRDLFQIVRERIDVMFVGARGRKPVIYDRAAVERRYGLRPEQLPSRTALAGDASDNLPKVPGIGERGAEALVRNFGDVHSLLSQLSSVTPTRLREALERAADQIRSTEALARLRQDVPLPAGPRHAPVAADDLERLRALFTQLEFRSLLPRLDGLAQAGA